MNETTLLVLLYTLTFMGLASVLKRTNLLTVQTLARSSPLDALRGILATAVVCHHFVITYYWKKDGIWARPPSELLNNAGAVSVSLFFMITGYLFFEKTYRKNPNWLTLYKSRLFRITPLYTVAMIAVFILSLNSTKSTTNDLTQIAHDVITWTFYLGNSFAGYEDANLITAGAHWTLRYEWVFYFMLPLLALAVNRQSSGRYLLISLFALLLMAYGTHTGALRPSLFMLFMLGAIPSLLQQHSSRFVAHLKGRLAAITTLIVLGWSMLMLPAYSMMQMIALALPFAVIAVGNDLFGLLKGPGMKTLGEISYSIYLLHGIVLYSIFTQLELFDFGRNSLLSYTLTLPGILGITVILATVTFRWVEVPFIRLGHQTPSSDKTRPVLSPARPD